MEQRDHVSSDIELANSFRHKFNMLYPLSTEYSIYRVPETTRCLNPSDYTPKMVSIGPIHHGRKELQAMEEHKIRYLKHFLERNKVNMDDCISFIRRREAQLRSCYAETIDLNSNDFVKIILVDAVFLIEYLLRGSNLASITDDDRMFRKPRFNILDDLWLVENQIPLFIINDLFELAKTATNSHYYGDDSLLKITDWLKPNILPYIPVGNNLSRYLSEAKHFLDWLRLGIPCRGPSKYEFENESIPSAKQLLQAGVKITKAESSKSLFDITFNEGHLEIPFLRVYNPTQRVFQNILAFENMHCGTHCFNDYILFMSYLIGTTKDAELLIQKKVIVHRNGEQLSTIFQNLNKNCEWHENFHYSDVAVSLRKHCEYTRNEWKAILKQNHCNNPWAIISVIAAVMLLVLTIIQTTCSIIALP